MALSDEDMRRIEEEEYRKLARERLERTVRIEADIRSSGDQRVEVRGVGTEMYRDAKGAARSARSALYRVLFVPFFILIILSCLFGSFRSAQSLAGDGLGEVVLAVIMTAIGMVGLIVGVRVCSNYFTAP